MERRLATILAADVVGYSRLMEADEQGTLSALRAARSAIDKLIEENSGRIFSSAGDSIVAEFGSPVLAMRCAVKVQRHFSELRSGARSEPVLQLRVGVNLGDVATDGNNLLGTGVKIAARLEQGEVACILVDDAVAQITSNVIRRFTE